MTLFLALIIFILGTAIGSFLSVVNYRIHSKDKKIIFSRSVCPHCKKKLKWRHLIPVFSWLFLRGKCAYCNEKISPNYLFIEIVTGTLFLAIFLKWNFLETAGSLVNPDFINYSINWTTFEIFFYHLIIFSFLTAIFFYDLKYREIPDRISLPAIGIALAGGLIFEFVSITSMIIGALAIFGFFLAQFVLSKGKWIGGGDLRLGALMGLMLGWQQGLIALIAAYLLGSLISVGLLTQGSVNRKSAIPFGPFLVMGILISVFFGEIIMEWYLSLLQI